MRNKDILLVVLFVILVLGIAFGPGLLDRWRARDAAVEPGEPQTVDLGANGDDRPQLTPEQQAKAERVSGLLRLHEACVERFEGFDAESQAVAAAWEERYGELLAAKPDQDFRIVLAQPEGLDEAAIERARTEERALCERNLETMRTDLEKGGDTPQ